MDPPQNTPLPDRPRARPPGTYGIDAPWVPWMWFGFCVIFLAIAIINASAGPSSTGDWLWGVLLIFVLACLWFAGGALYLYASRRGKFEVWSEQLDALPLTGTERVLDLGCGHGAVTILAARRVPHGTVTGIDLWRSVDQSGNSMDATQANLDLNGVAGRVGLDTGDMARLPYADGSFDLVTASVALHNIPDRDGRAQAVTEAVRVLRPGGRLLVVDIQRVSEYAATLSSLGATVDRCAGAGWRLWWSGPWMATTVLLATTAKVPAAR